jgi:DNA transformation protein
MLGLSGTRPYNSPQAFNHRRFLAMPDEFIEYVMELFGPFGTVGVRRMFGGHGMYLDGLMFAIVSDDTLYLKADEMNRVEFEQASCEVFGYARKGKRATLNFFRAPEEAMESPQLMLPWARTAYAAALRTNAKKQVAEQARAAAKIARAEETARPAKTAGPGKKQPLKRARAAEPTRRKTTNRKPARLSPTVTRGKRK